MILQTEPKDTEGEKLEIPEITPRIYRELFDLSAWLLKAKPWKRMLDIHSFVLIDPDTGDEQLASIIGNAGNNHGFLLHQPDEGTRWVTLLQLQGHNPWTQQLAEYDNRFLEVYFSDGEESDVHDEELDLEYAPEEWIEEENSMGDLDFVTFRSVIPGCPRWHPTEEEALRMLDGLRLMRRYYEEKFTDYDWATFTVDGLNAISMPTFSLPKGAKREDASAWEFSMRDYTPPGPKELPKVPRDEFFLGRIAHLKVKAGTHWELGAVFGPNPITDQGRPTFPVIAAVAVRETGRVEGMDLGPAVEPRHQILRRCFAAAALELGYLPQKLSVASPIAELALEETAKDTGMTILSDETGLGQFSDFVDSLQRSPIFAVDHEEESFLDEMDPEDIKKIDNLMHEAPNENSHPDEISKFMGKLMEVPGSGVLLNNFLKQMDESGDFDDRPADAPRTRIYSPPKSNTRYVFRIDLVGAKPPIWRRISLPIDATFFDLHLAIQAAFGWEGYHLHAFEKRLNGIPWLVIDWLGEAPEMVFQDHDVAVETEVELRQFFGGGEDSINYVYDFGDHWDHKIQLEKTVEEPGGNAAPFDVIKGRGAFLPEDVGGVWGLMDILDGASPAAEEMLSPEQIMEIQSGKFDPKEMLPRDPHKEMEILDMMNSS